MNRWSSLSIPLLIVALVLNFVALGVSQIRGVINAAALQGIVLGILSFFVHPEIGFRGIVLDQHDTPKPDLRVDEELRIPSTIP